MSADVPGQNPDDPGFVYDEFSLFAGNCEEFDLAWDGSVPVRRVTTGLADGRQMSALKWGNGSPEVVFLHGGAQNAHTWDTVALMLRPRSLLAIDLPGHGHSSWRDDRSYSVAENATDVATVIDEHAPDSRLVVGMSFGGLIANSLAATYPWLVRRLVIVDITPGVNPEKASAVHAFIAGPQSFETFTEIFERTVRYNPTRSRESLKRGILHNAHRVDDGSWEWNYDRRQMADAVEYSDTDSGISARWDDLEEIPAPYLLVRGELSPVVDDDDVAELMRRNPGARVQTVSGAGHSIQGDQPVALTRIIEAELDSEPV